MDILILCVCSVALMLFGLALAPFILSGRISRREEERDE